MPKYLFERSATFRAFFHMGASCWPLLKAQVELLPRPDGAALLRGWFYSRTSVPTGAVGEPAFVRHGYRARTPHVMVALAEEVLGVWRREFTSALTDVPPVWTGPSAPEGAQVASLAELKNLLGSLDGADIACFDAEGGFRLHQ
jgi:hypothetical protein